MHNLKASGRYAELKGSLGIRGIEVRRTAKKGVSLNVVGEVCAYTRTSVARGLEGEGVNVNFPRCLGIFQFFRPDESSARNGGI